MTKQKNFKTHILIFSWWNVTMTEDRCQMCYLHGRGRKKILYAAFRCRTWLRLFPFPPSFCLICCFQTFLCRVGACSIGAQRIVQFKWMGLVNQVKGASMGEFTRLAPTQLLTIQETGIGTKLWRNIWYMWTLYFGIHTVNLWVVREAGCV